MISTQPAPQSDIWSDWLLHRRQANDQAYGRVIRAEVEAYADRVLDGAGLRSGMSLVDVGTGDGLVGFRAIERIGPTLRVVLTDVSVPMLRHAETLAVQRGVLDQCTFLEFTAEQLKGIADASVDVVTTRSVLAYVSDKSGALREFHRVLKPGGCISIAEPIFRDEALSVIAMKTVLNARPADFARSFTTSSASLEVCTISRHGSKNGAKPNHQLCRA